jgi:hypothetical protein
MATRRQVETAIRRLTAALNRVDPQVRESLIPARTVSLLVPDLDLAFAGKLAAGGVTDVEAVDEETAGRAEVRLVADSDQVVFIGTRPAAFVPAWVHGRVRVHAQLRDLLELGRLIASGL